MKGIPPYFFYNDSKLWRYLFANPTDDQQVCLVLSTFYSWNQDNVPVKHKKNHNS